MAAKSSSKAPAAKVPAPAAKPVTVTTGGKTYTAPVGAQAGWLADAKKAGTGTPVASSNPNTTLTQAAYDKLVAGSTKAQVDALMKDKGFTIATPAPVVDTTPVVDTGSTKPVFTSKVSPQMATSKVIAQDKYDAMVKDSGNKDLVDSKMKEMGFTLATPAQDSTQVDGNTKVVETTKQQETNTAADVAKETYIAPNNKQYAIGKEADGKVSFIGQDGGKKVFDTPEQARAAIDAGNAKGTTVDYGTLQKDSIFGPGVTSGKGELETVDNAINEAGKSLERDTAQADTTMSQKQSFIDKYGSLLGDTTTALDSNITDQITAMNKGFSDVQAELANLETKANEQFDVQKMVARQQQAQNLADQGILTSEQAASAATYSLQNYVMEVELKRSEIIQKMAEMKTNALKEKTTMQNKILQQSGLNEVTKAEMMKGLSEMYTGMIDKYDTAIDAANVRFDSAIQNANNTNVQVELAQKSPIIQEKAAQELLGEKKAKANTDAGYRTQYILDTVSSLAPSLISLVAARIKAKQKAGTFMASDVQTLLTELLAK